MILRSKQALLSLILLSAGAAHAHAQGPDQLRYYSNEWGYLPRT